MQNIFLMKKKLIGSCAVVVLGVLAVAGVHLQDKERLSDVALANIEALANGEATPGSQCFHSFTSQQEDPMRPVWVSVPYCGEDCRLIRCAYAWDEGEC